MRRKELIETLMSRDFEVNFGKVAQVMERVDASAGSYLVGVFPQM